MPGLNWQITMMSSQNVFRIQGLHLLFESSVTQFTGSFFRRKLVLHCISFYVNVDAGKGQTLSFTKLADKLCVSQGFVATQTMFNVKNVALVMVLKSSQKLIATRFFHLPCNE